MILNRKLWQHLFRLDSVIAEMEYTCTSAVAATELVKCFIPNSVSFVAGEMSSSTNPSLSLHMFTKK